MPLPFIIFFLTITFPFSTSTFLCLLPSYFFIVFFTSSFPSYFFLFFPAYTFTWLLFFCLLCTLSFLPFLPAISYFPFLFLSYTFLLFHAFTFPSLCSHYIACFILIPFLCFLFFFSLFLSSFPLHFPTKFANNLCYFILIYINFANNNNVLVYKTVVKKLSFKTSYIRA